METTTCVIVGGGPAGVMLGLLLARAGIDVTVLEKHNDFLRDFRGDTVHPSTIRLLDELGLGEGFRRLPQSSLDNVALPVVGGGTVVLGNFDLLAPPYNYVALVPQWDLLNFLVESARPEPSFHIRMNTRATDLVRDGDRVTGVLWAAADGTAGTLHADLVVACDGRDSSLRTAAELTPRSFPVPFDTWWFRLSRPESERGGRGTLTPRFAGADILLLIPRDTYYQVAYFAEKGADVRLRNEGVESFRRRIANLCPEFVDRLDEITGMDDLHMLDVTLNRIRPWHRDGLLLIGDAAHAMSPAGGVGINLAIQDAVAAARILAPHLMAGTVTPRRLAAVRRRRWMPTVVIQRFQRMLHRAIFEPALAGEATGPPRLLLAAVRGFPGLSSLPPRLIGFGPRPEHAPDFARRPDVEDLG